MRRALVQFDEETYRRLRQRAFRQERSVSSLVRELVARGLEGRAAGRRPTRITELASVRAGQSRQGRVTPVSERYDEALGAAFKT
jgi:plasmid stability protein